MKWLNSTKTEYNFYSTEPNNIQSFHFKNTTGSGTDYVHTTNGKITILQNPIGTIWLLFIALANIYISILQNSFYKLKQNEIKCSCMKWFCCFLQIGTIQLAQFGFVFEKWINRIQFNYYSSILWDCRVQSLCCKYNLNVH